MGKSNQELFPTGKKKRSELLALKREEISAHTLKAKEDQKPSFSWFNSPLNGSYESLQATFDDVLTSDKHYDFGLKDYIERALVQKKGRAVGIEFGGVGSSLFAGFSLHFFKKTAGVVLVDERTKSSNRGILQQDTSRKHDVIEGDVLSSGLYDSKIKNWLQGDKADLIIERMAKGLDLIPADPYTLSRIVGRWYGILADGGIMLIQVPIVFNKILTPWAEMLQSDFKDTLDVQYKLGIKDSEHPSSVIKIRKLAHAPEQLPLLDPRTIGKISRGKTLENGKK